VKEMGFQLVKERDVERLDTGEQHYIQGNGHQGTL